MKSPYLLFALSLMVAPPLQAADMGNYKAPPAAGCVALPSSAPLTLADAVQQAFCRNPQTRLWWANVASQQAQLKQAEAAYWPQLSAQYEASRKRTRTDSYSTDTHPQSINLSASYILYDFGGRDAAARLAEAQLRAAIATGDDSLNSLAYQVAQAYLDALLAQASLQAARISEESSLEALNAAKTRLSVGNTIPATVLQAKTAYAQAKLARIKAEGTVSTSRAKLATLMGLPPDTSFQQAEWRIDRAKDEPRHVASLIDDALASRQDLAAAREQVKAAQASVDSARAQGKPTLSLGATAGRQIGTSSGDINSGSLGVTLSVPIFTGYKDTYRIRASEADLDGKRATEASLANQIKLDVWNAYRTLQTNSDALQSAHDAVVSGEANAQVQLGRFQAGVGTMLDVLSAQASAASARQQLATAEHDYLLSKFTLAQALGQLDSGTLPSMGD